MAYKISPYEKHTIKPLQWWTEQGRPQEFPYMSALARRLLFIPASSAGLERVFSQSGLMLSGLRQKLGTSTLEDLMVLKYTTETAAST